jgi:uncharacterized protein (DUF3084 family)
MSNTTYIIIIIASLVVASGVIAYVGDVLGSYIGKKRLSLFGTRPKRTGQIIGIGAGVAITLTTLGVSALVFRGAVNTIFNAQAVSQRLAELEVQEKNLLQQVQGLEAQKAETQQALDEAQAKIDSAESQQRAAETERDNALAEVTALVTQQTTLEADEKKLQLELQELQANLATGQTQLTIAQNDLQTAQDDLANAQSELSSAKDQRQAALDDAAEAQSEAEVATQQVNNLQAQINTVQEQLNAKTEDLATQSEALVETRNNLEITESDLATAQQDRDAALQARREAEAQIKSLEVTRDALNNSLQTIQREVDNYEKQAAELTAQNTELNTQNQKLLEESTTLNAANDGLKEQNRDLTNSNDILNTQAQVLKDQMINLNQQLDEQARQLDIVTEQMRAVDRGDLTYSTNAAIHNGVISSQDPIEIRAELAQLFSVANSKTAERGAGPIEPRTEQLENLVQAISESPNADIVTLRSPYNQFGSAPVTVDVEAIENQRLASRGQLVVSRQIHLGSDLLPMTSGEVSSKVRELLRDANDKLLSLGLADNVDTATDGSSLSPEAFSNDLERLTGVITIGLVATDEIYSSGPVNLSLVIIN